VILVTGASGFIGNKFYLYFKENNMRIKGTYYSNGPGDLDKLDKENRIYLDMKRGDMEEIKRLKDLEYMIFCHGISDIETCRNKRELSYAVNVTNTINLLRHCRHSSIVPVYLSTTMVFDGETESSSESSDPNPLSEYGKQKLEVEKFIADNFEKYLILRLTKVFGVEKYDKSIFTSWLDKFMQKEKIAAASDVFISPVYVMDVIRITELLMKNNHFGSYNLGGPEISRISDFAIRLAGFFDYDSGLIREVSINDLGFTEKRPRFNSVDSTKILRESGIKLTAIRDCFNLIAENYGIKVNRP
jgi:dTDP-4-dehydrorhamnose reductase